MSLMPGDRVSKGGVVLPNGPLKTAPPSYDVVQFHTNDDVDASAQAHHHTLGYLKNQSAPGEAVNKRLIKPFTLLSCGVDNVGAVGTIAPGAIATSHYSATTGGAIPVNMQANMLCLSVMWPAWGAANNVACYWQLGIRPGHDLSGNSDRTYGLGGGLSSTRNVSGSGSLRRHTFSNTIPEMGVALTIWIDEPAKFAPNGVIHIYANCSNDAGSGAAVTPGYMHWSSSWFKGA